MCKQCLLQLSRAFAFKQQVETADDHLRRYCTQGFTDDTLIKPIFSEDFLYYKALTSKIYTITSVKSQADDDLVLPDDNESHFNDVLELVNNEGIQSDLHHNGDEALEDTKNEYIGSMPNESIELIQNEDSIVQQDIREEKTGSPEELTFTTNKKKARKKSKPVVYEELITDDVDQVSRSGDEADYDIGNFTCVVCLKEFPNKQSLVSHTMRCSSSKKLKLKVSIFKIKQL